MITPIQKIVSLLGLLVLSLNSFADLSGDWEGQLNINGVVLPIVIHLSKDEGQVTGTMDSPAQGAFDIPMTLVEISDKELMFEVSNISIHYSGTYDAETAQIEGNFIQGSVTPLNFSKTNKNTKQTSSSELKEIMGQWGGTVEIPGNPLSLILHIEDDAGVVKATADSPDQGATGLKVDQVSLEGDVMTFTMKALGVQFTGQLSKDQNTIKGDFIQQGKLAKLELVRGASPKQVHKRPQNPEPPYNYKVEDVVVENKQAGITLAGTLTLPKNQKIKAVAVLVTGSGPQDRDETVFEHKPFWIIADYLTQHGYAILRMDDRGVGESTGNFNNATSEDFVTDINAAVSFLKTRADLPAGKVGVIGHSEGGMIGPMLAAERDDLAFVIMLAGPGIPITELLAEQKYLIALANGGDEQTLKEEHKTDLAFNRLLAKYANSDQYISQARDYLKKQMQDQLNDEAQLDATINSMIKQFDTVWFRYFIAFNPGPYLKKVKAPVLAINGTNDLQVAAESNLTGIKSILKKAGHQDFTTLPLKNLNHLLQSSETGSPNEYIKIENTVDPIALHAMSEWLDTRFK